MDNFTSEPKTHFPGKVVLFLQPDSGKYRGEMAVYAPSVPLRFISISEGNFEKKGNKLTFRDRRAGFIIEGEFIDYNKTLLKFKSGFPFILGDTVKGYGGSPNDNSLLIRHLNEKEWKEWKYPHDRIETLKSTPARQRLASGIYQNDYVFLRFKNNKTYDLYYTGSLISTGTWKQENSSVTLEDKSLQCNFYMGLDEKGRLRSVLLPGLYTPELQNLIFTRIDKFPDGTGDVPYEYETIEVKDPDYELGACYIIETD